MKNIYRILIVASVVLLITGCNSIPDDLTGQLAFSSSMENDGAYDIYYLNLPNTKEIQLTKTQGEQVENTWIDWAKNGRMVYASTRNGNYEIYLMDVGRKQETKLTENDFFDGYPTFNPEGNLIAFISEPEPLQKDIYLMDIESRKLKQLTKTPGAEAYLAWSPDGTRLAYAMYVKGYSEIFVYNLSTGESIQLTNNSRIEDINPGWSPDSKRIFFASDRENNPDDGLQAKRYWIYSMNATDGSDVKTIVQDEKCTFGDPRVSPNGKYLCYCTKRIDKFWDRMYLEAMDLSNQKTYTLVKNDFYNRNPAWKP